MMAIPESFTFAGRVSEYEGDTDIEMRSEHEKYTVATVRDEWAPMFLALPKLLEACRALVADIEQREPCWCLGRAPDDVTEPGPCEACQARAAIAAAKGE